MRRNSMSLGVGLILLGCLLLANRLFGFDLFSMSKFWPIFVLVPGLIFQFAFFATGRNPGLLVPGGILTTIGLLFFFEAFTNFYFAEYTWPVYIFAVAVGLFQLYLFGGRVPGLLIPVFILTLISVVSFVMIVFGGLIEWFSVSNILPAALILMGVFILLSRFYSARG